MFLFQRERFFTQHEVSVGGFVVGMTADQHCFGPKPVRLRLRFV
jgi:hypothetical protein